MLTIDKKFLIGFSIILITVASLITVYSPLFWIFHPPHSSVIYETGTVSPDQAFYENYTIIFPFNLTINYIKNGTIYSPNKVPFFNFLLNGSRLKDFQKPDKLNNFQDKIDSYNIGMYFYLFKTNNGQSKLIQTQNRTYNVDLNHDFLSGNLYWHYQTIPMFLTSIKTSELYYCQFIFTITTHLFSDTNGSYITFRVYDYAPQIQYHIFNRTQFVVDKYNSLSEPIFSSFTFITQGVLNVSILVSGLIFIAIVILILTLKNKKKISNN